MRHNERYEIVEWTWDENGKLLGATTYFKTDDYKEAKREFERIKKEYPDREIHFYDIEHDY